MNKSAIDQLAWRYGEPKSVGVIKHSPEDFTVVEDLGYEPDGEGEHLLVRVRKTGCNTQFVAEQLAKFAGISARSVSYAGLKDRQAVTEQWFCLHLPGKSDPDMSRFALEGCQVLTFARHRRKLKIGNLKGNAFTLVLRDIIVGDDIDGRLKQIAEGGVPNYFGPQRFGRDGNNLIQAQRWANGEIRVKERHKRSFYLSAVRSALFNVIAAKRIELALAETVINGDALQLSGRGSWFIAKEEELAQLQHRVEQKELFVTAPLVGDGELGTQQQALAFEQDPLLTYSDFISLLRQERLAPARRAIIVIPQRFIWRWLDKTTLEIQFSLPAGSFATSVVREIIGIRDGALADSLE
jgi:tRNA pseudouridine13 synthase